MAKQAKAPAVSASAKKQQALLDMLESMGKIAKGTGPAGSAVAGSGAMQQKNLEAMLSQLFPEGMPVAKEAAAAAAPAVAGAPMSAEAAAAAMEGMQTANAAAAAPGKLSLEKIFGKGKAALKTPLGKGLGVVGVAMLIDSLMKGGLNIAGQLGQANLQGQALDAQAAAMGPQAMTERAMQPITKAQRDQALMLLMQQLGVKQSNVADGEAWT